MFAFHSKIRLPKWVNVVGGLVAIQPYLPQVQSYVPPKYHVAYGLVSGIIGVVINAYTTPIQANTMAGGVVKPGEPPVQPQNAVAGLPNADGSGDTGNGNPNQ